MTQNMLNLPFYWIPKYIHFLKSGYWLRKNITHQNLMVYFRNMNMVPMHHWKRIAGSLMNGKIISFEAGHKLTFSLVAERDHYNS